MRTAEQIAADHLLAQAIEQAHRAYRGTDDGEVAPEHIEDGMLGDYVVIYAMTGLDTEAEPDTGTFHLTRHGLAYHCLLGLLDATQRSV